MRTYCLLIFSAIFILSACKDMDGIYEDFVVPNGLKYPQKADSLKAYSGFNKLRLKWVKPTDPKVKYAKIYGNNYPDTIRIDIPTDEDDTVRVDIPDLNEATYTFYVRTFDAEGNASIPVEVTGTPYGENYLISAANRSITSALRDDDNRGTIRLGPKTPDLAYSEIRYVTASGETKTGRILPDQNEVAFPDVKPEEIIEYRSVFLPPNGIEHAVGNWQTYEDPFMYKYPRSEWTAASRDGNHGWGDAGGEPYRILDGNLATGWHTRVGSSMPQCVVVDMQELRTIHRLLVYPIDKENEVYLQQVEVYLSNAPITPGVPDESWGEPVATVSYDGTNPFTINMNEAVSGRYLALVFPDSRVNTYISFMELEVYGH